MEWTLNQTVIDGKEVFPGDEKTYKNCVFCAGVDAKCTIFNNNKILFELVNVQCIPHWKGMLICGIEKKCVRGQVRLVCQKFWAEASSLNENDKEIK